MTSAWLPSRRSTEHQMGGFSMASLNIQSILTPFGIKYCFLYFSQFFISLPFSSAVTTLFKTKKPLLRNSTERLVCIKETKALALRGTTLIWCDAPTRRRARHDFPVTGEPVRAYLTEAPSFGRQLREEYPSPCAPSRTDRRLSLPRREVLFPS